uniref:Immunoglobulin V-set domain-containing protein n=1 Tax=Hippocampus comes TaxID=109280 RepID=A0A3Q2YPZ1_HIPCM
ESWSLNMSPNAEMLLSHPSGTSSELVVVTTEMLASKGGRVTLSYVYAKKSMSSHYIFWYKQLPGQAPHFLSHSGNGKPLNGSTRMSVSVTNCAQIVRLFACLATRSKNNKKRFQRQITRERREYTNEISQVQ